MPQRTVADVDDPRPQDAARVDAQRVLVMEAVVEERAGEVVRGTDGVHVAGQVEVEVLHRDDLAVAAAGRATLDPEHRPERGLPDVHRGPFADVVEALGEPDRRGRLAFAERRRGDRGDDDVLAARPFRLEPADRLHRHLGLGRTVELELVVGDPQVARDVHDRARLDRAGDLEVGREAHRSPLVRGRFAGVGPAPVGLAFCGPDQVGQQQGVGQRPDAAWDRRDRRGDLARRFEVDVADDPTVDHVDPDVHDDRARLEHGAGHEPGLAGGHDDDVGPADVPGQIPRSTMAHGDRRVLLDQQERSGHPDDGRPADDDGVAPLDLDPRSAQDLDRGVGRGRQEAVVAEAKQPGVERMDPVDVLGRVDRVDDRSKPDGAREWHLDDDAVDGRVVVQVANRRRDLGLGRLALELDEAAVDPDLGAAPQDPFEVDGRRRVLADDHDPQPGWAALGRW